nr:dienelactone hydrolase family protein [Alteromonas halophila]
MEKVILMAAPSVPLRDIVLYQVREDYTRLHINQSLVERGVSAHHRLLWAIQNEQAIGATLAHFQNTLVEVLAAAPENDNQPLTALKASAAKQTQEYRAVYALPSLTSFINHDPALDIAALTSPVLGLFGGRDRQVTIGQNKDVMENALLQSGVHYTLVTFEKANHYFQSAETGRRDEYVRLNKQFVPTFLQVISDWILNAEDN